MKNIPAKKYVYVLTSDKKVFADFDDLQFEIYDPAIHPFTIYDGWKVIDDTLYANTSCGANNMSFFRGTRIQTAYSVFKYYLKFFCNHIMDMEIQDFIPSITFNRFPIKCADAFMHKSTFKRFVMIVNGETQSGQTLNFDMYPLIQVLSAEYPGVLFLISNSIDSLSYRHGKMLCKDKSPFKYNPGDNIAVCKDILGLSGNDIVETSYFSRYCSLIVGRSSGVYTLSIEKTNVIDSPKKFICFSHYERDKDLGVCEILPHMNENFIWSNNYNYSSMLNIIRNQLG